MEDKSASLDLEFDLISVWVKKLIYGKGAFIDVTIEFDDAEMKALSDACQPHPLLSHS